MTTAITDKSKTEVVLESPLEMRYALSMRHTAIIALGCALFLVLNYMPLRSTDLWGHIAYGQSILQNGSLPIGDPILKLAEGMPVVDSAWLSQVIFASVDQLGIEALSSLFAVTLLTTFVLLARSFTLQSHSTFVAVVGGALVLAIGWSRLAMIQPENFAMLCFALLLWLILSSRHNEQVTRNRTWRLWLGVPLVMALWANLDGSFICGLVVLACFLIGRVVETIWRTGRLSAVLADRETHLWLGLCELGTLATLINPYGVNLWFHTMWFASNENLRDVLEWQSLTFLNAGGREFALSWVLLLLVLRHSRRRMPVAHALLLGVFSVLAVCGIRMLSWYAVIFVMVLVPHLSYLINRADLASRFWHREAPTSDRVAGWRPTLLALLMVWTTFALSGLSQPVLGGVARSDGQLLDDSTPLALTEYLRAYPPQGQVFNPQWWGDWLAMRGPADFQPFMTSSIHLAPRSVWLDYQMISFVEPGWQRALDRYRVNTLIIDKGQQAMLASVMRQADDWSLDYEDDQALVFVRVGTTEPELSDADQGPVATEATTAGRKRR